MSFSLNEVIGNYECLGIISKPRSGVTYKVRNLATGEVESLRALRGAAAGDAESAERLAREIRIHTRLTHPNVVGFHDAFELEGQLVMTTDYVGGRTLADLRREGPLPEAEAVRIMLQVLAGLEEAHALGIVHRGITADHIHIGTDGAVKLGGFDLAKPVADTNLTKVGAVIGDPRYISPEQVIGQQEPDPRSDLYSAGVALYLAVTGKLPFDGDSDIDVLSAHVNSEPRPLRDLNPQVSTELEAIVLRALRKKPEERFSSAREFRECLAGQKAAEAAAPVPQSAGAAERPAQSPGKPWVWGAALVLAGVATVAWIALR